ncbi:AMP-binding protein [Streptomyces sp. NPDC058371]|uniref:AMP-binding protein n=1 Tax=Streptomyces sp. NPDC058371 TaxID=3346463 RepID=UPI003665203D
MTTHITSVPELLHRQAQAHPDRIALSDGTRSLDYRALERSARRIAVRLTGRGVGRGQRVALLGPRDVRLFTMLYGVLRSGATAVVAGEEWSEPDLCRRLTAVSASCMLTSGPDVRVPAGWQGDVVDVDALSGTSPEATPMTDAPQGTDLAYLSFTSGSAGEPKAVAVSHANVVHYAQALRDRLGLTDDDVPCVAHMTTLAADLGHTSWLLALATGGRVHVVPDHLTRDPEAFWPSVREAGVSMMKTTPTHLTALLEERPAGAPTLATVLLGGEVLSRSFAVRLLDEGIAHRVVNHYGPTETTIGATSFVANAVADLPTGEATVPIGTALGDGVLRLVDDDGRTVADEQPGQLLIGGPGVSAGYFGRTEETARCFVAYDGERMYRTGDICRRRRDGTLVFLGRSDRQVKIRGFRVDPAEVERIIDAWPGVAASAVLVRSAPAGDRLLAAVRLAGTDETALDELRAHLHERLPGYSIPAPIVALSKFPAGPSGKLDRACLLKALDEVIAQRAGRVSSTSGDRPIPADPLLVEDIAGLWAGALGLPEVAFDADVLALGGDSILAMRTVALVRRHGYQITFEDFYLSPTPRSLAAAARPVRDDTAEPMRTDRGRRVLAPAQRWFFSQGVEEAGHWNQAVLLRCCRPVDAGALSGAVAAVLERHPALRRPVGPDGPADKARAVADLEAVTFSRLPPEPDRIAPVVEGVCGELQRSMNPASGRLVRVHLFRGEGGSDDRLAIVVHHLAIDGLSWRILLDDLAVAYRAMLVDGRAQLPPTSDFYRWAATRPPLGPVHASPDLPPLPLDGPSGGAEPAALSWTLNEAATADLSARHGRAQRLEAILLAAFADAVSDWSRRPGITVEVETHGRDVDSAEYLDTIGWFTAVKRVPLRRRNRIDEVERRVREAPLLPMDAEGMRPEAGFNFLGAFQLPDEPALGWTVATESPGVARCPSGDPLYRLRLTARLVEGRLVTDLVYAAPALSHSSAERIMAAFGRDVAAAAGAEAPAPVAVPESTSGQLLYTGATRRRWRRSVVSEPARVLLTGATGYLGGHLLTELTARGARVTCLVRGRPEADAAQRLTGRDGVDVVVGDITQDGLGLSTTGLAAARTAQVVLHAAADVRLVASPTELVGTNTAAVRRLLDWLDTETDGVRFHHISTLAVAGHLDGSPRVFGEADLDIGQSFHNSYERSKFSAEELVRSWASSGRQAVVHRSGHIAAHSRSGVFQRNVADNRVYQLIRGYILAGAAPRRPGTRFAFSHVDTVAGGIAALALQPYTAPGTYHVETPYELPHDELVGWLNDCGYPVTLTGDDDFAEIISRVEQQHQVAARLAETWSRLPDRNIVVDSSYTTSVLARAGVRFAEPTREWWAAALSWAEDVGFLSPVLTSRRTG